MKFNYIFNTPLWSKSKLLGLHKYPKKQSAQMRFWLSSTVYSLAYLYIIALFVVIFTHSLYGWSSWQNYLTTVLFDIIYKNPVLVVLFVAIESVLIFKKAHTPQIKKFIYPETKIKTVLMPALYVMTIYLILKLMTKSAEFEPYAVIVLLVTYIFFLILRLLKRYILQRT